MKQLALELNGYPRPIAWTLSEVDRAMGDRDRRDMLLTAFEEVTRYIVLVQLARYSEYWAGDRGDDAVDRRIADLRRPSFGHYVSALATLDPFLAAANDAYTIHAHERGEAPGMLRLCSANAQSPAKRVSVIGLLTRIVEIRNREKGHGYTAQPDARTATEHLQPALTEFLCRMPILLARPLVWIERIEYLDQDRWVITLLELMGTQRARRITREVQRPGHLKKGFIYMWDGESAPLQLTPFMHLEQVSHDEIVYVLAGLAGEPIYQARGAAEKSRTADQLLTQLTERAPFLLKSPPSVTAPRNPEAERWYRSAVDLALSDGQISDAEAERLVMMREDLGLTEAEAEAIHLELGWAPPATSPIVGEARPSPPPPAVDDASAPHRYLSAVMSHLRGVEGFSHPIELDPETDYADGELQITLDRTQVVSVWFGRRRNDRTRLIVGFYSLNQKRDPRYRLTRDALASGGAPSLPPGWSRFTQRSRVSALAFETSTSMSVESVEALACVDDVATLVLSLVRAAAAARVEDERPESGVAPLEVQDAPVSRDVPEAFELPPLEGAPRLQGSVWKARILWALEWARRHDPTPKTAADIARILCSNGVQVPPTNTARAFRTEKDDPRVTGLCEEVGEQTYVITPLGRRGLFELLSGTADG